MTRWGLFVFVLLLPWMSQAQRRDAPVAQSHEITLDVAVLFDKVVVPAGHYRVNLQDKHFFFADSATMRLVASIPVDERPAEIPSAALVLEKKDTTVELLLRAPEATYYRKGVITQITNEKENSNTLNKEERQVRSSSLEPTGDAALVQAAVNRYISGVLHCGERAIKSSWQTDDAHFTTCVCAIASKWRMPAVSKDVFVSFFLTKNKNGFSLVSTPQGKLTQCRVWVGKEAPPPATQTPNPPTPKSH